MSLVHCEYHNKKKDYLFCLNHACRERLVCDKCNARENLHRDHRVLLIRDFLKSDEEELRVAFG